MTDIDPGWRPALRKMLLALAIVPTLRRSYRAPLDGISELRAIWVSMTCTPFAYLFVLSFIPHEEATEPARWAPSLVVAVGIIGLVSVQWTRHRALDVSSPQALARSYRGAMFLGIGCADVPALAGFVCTFFGPDLWPYVLGLGFTLAGLVLVAPTGRDFRRRQEQITSRGSPLSVVSALLAFPSTNAAKKA